MAKIRNLVLYVSSQGEAERLVREYVYIGRTARWEPDASTGRIKVTVLAQLGRKKRQKRRPNLPGRN